MIEHIPFRVRPMLATLVPEPFHRPGWVYEEKYDGIRIVAYKEGAKVTLLSRDDLDRSASFADIATAIGHLPDRTLLLVGEVVPFDSKKYRGSSFFNVETRHSASRSSIAFIATVAIFDTNHLLIAGNGWKRRWQKRPR